MYFAMLFCLQSCVHPFVYVLFLYTTGFPIRALFLTPLLHSVMAEVQEGPCLAALLVVLPLLVLSFPESHVLLALMPSSCCPVMKIRAYQMQITPFCAPTLSATPSLSYAVCWVGWKDHGDMRGEVVAGTG